MRYSVELKDTIYGKDMNFCLLQKNKGTKLSSKYGEKFLDSAKKSTINAIKTASKKAIQKTPELVI